MQFDCNECLILEYSYHAFLITGKNEQFRLVEIKLGTVDMESSSLITMDEPAREIHVRRSGDNSQRKRPNGKGRHDPFSARDGGQSSVSLTNVCEQEGLSHNWSLYRESQMPPSTRRTILFMFEHDFQYLPSLREIRDGLTRAEMTELDRYSE